MSGDCILDSKEPGPFSGPFVIFQCEDLKSSTIRLPDSARGLSSPFWNECQRLVCEGIE